MLQYFPLQSYAWPTVILKDNVVTLVQAAARTHQSLPTIGFQVGTFGEQKDLNGTPCFGALAQQARRYDPALISDQEITGSQVCANITKMAMLQSARFSLEHQQA
jgi:hypothetical protein